MKRARTYVFLTGTIVICLLGLSERRKSAAQSENFANHYKQLMFSLPYGEWPSFELPVNGSPVSVSVAVSSLVVSGQGLTANTGAQVLAATAAISDTAGLNPADCEELSVSAPTCSSTTFFTVAGIGTLNDIIQINRSTGTLTVMLVPASNTMTVTSPTVNYTVTMFY